MLEIPLILGSTKVEAFVRAAVLHVVVQYVRHAESQPAILILLSVACITLFLGRPTPPCRNLELVTKVCRVRADLLTT